MRFSTLARIAVLALVVGCLDPARAQQPPAESIASAKELIATKGGGMFDPLIPGVIESVKNALVPTNPQLIRELNEVSAQLRKEYDAKRAELLNEVATVYARHFTAQELKDIVAFYKTPLGRKMITAEPLAVDESLRRAQEWADRLSEEVMGRFRAEMKKKGHTL